MLQRLRAKWRTWREHERQYALERALYKSPRNEDRPHGPALGEKAKGVDIQEIQPGGGG